MKANWELLSNKGGVLMKESLRTLYTKLLANCESVQFTAQYVSCLKVQHHLKDYSIYSI